MAFGRTDNPFLSTNAVLTCAPCLTVIAARLKLILGIKKISKRDSVRSFDLPAFHRQAQVSLKRFKVPLSIASLENTIHTSASVGKNGLLIIVFC